MSRVKTDRYRILAEEVAEGGAGGYESRYLTSEGSPASDALYAHLEKLDGGLLPAKNGMIRQRHGEVLVSTLADGKTLGVVSGFKPSGAYHFGHKLTSSAVGFFQRNGAQVFMPVADVECEMDTKLTREQYQFWAADNLVDWGANGVDLDAAHVYLQSEEHRVNELAYRVARSLSLELAVDTYGFKKLMEDFPFLFAGITQVGDILLGQHLAFGNDHSFMVSGQDQDGHMKMTISLVERSKDAGIPIPGLKTVPSGFYIPHIRGLIGKQSSSLPEGTIYLGQGPDHENLDGRIRTSVGKIDAAYADPEMRGKLERCALDMVRYIDFFNERSRIDFAELSHGVEHKGLLLKLEEARYGEEREAAQSSIDEYLIKASADGGQNNIELVRDSMREALAEHHQRRAKVIEYALERSRPKDAEPWGTEDVRLKKPEFWNAPERAIVDESKRNKTQWFNIVAAAKDRLQP